MFRSSLPLALAVAAAAQQPQPPAQDPARAFFASNPVVRVQVVLEPAERQKLRDKPREYATGTLTIDGAPFPGVGVKLKGAAGSYRGVDEGPCFTIHLGKFGKEARLHGLQRFHLNNGAQDESRLCEWIGSEVFAAAGLPAARVAHAHVWLDGKDLGIYVLREGYDKQFLQRAFGGAAGNLYDGGFCQDVDQALEKDAGDGANDHADLQRLCTACGGVDATREKTLAELVDVGPFVDFMALELMLCHWDGYTHNANNYRIWMPTKGGAVFLPHGMDQLLGDADAPVLDHPPAIVASAMMQQPALRKRYRDRIKTLLPLFDAARWTPRLQQLGDKLQQELHTTDDAASRALGEAVRGLIERLRDRSRALDKLVRAPEPKPLALVAGKPMRLDKWKPAAESDHVELQQKAMQGVGALQVTCVGRGDEPRHGSWRLHVLLAKGRYQLRGIARCDKLDPPPKDADGSAHGGVTLRVDGAVSERLTGDRGWQQLVCEFEVGEFQRTVALACDVRALAGKAGFRTDSLQLVRLPDSPADQGR